MRQTLDAPASTGSASTAAFDLTCACTFSSCACDVRVEPLHRARLDHTLGREPLAPQLARGGMRLDRRVEHRLRVHRLVGLVVSLATIAHEIDEEVLAESLTIREAEPHRCDARFGVVAIHVEDRNLEPFARSLA